MTVSAITGQTPALQQHPARAWALAEPAHQAVAVELVPAWPLFEVCEAPAPGNALVSPGANAPAERPGLTIAAEALLKLRAGQCADIASGQRADIGAGEAIVMAAGNPAALVADGGQHGALAGGAEEEQTSPGQPTVLTGALRQSLFPGQQPGPLTRPSAVARPR